jgi:hypothetical protein
LFVSTVFPAGLIAELFPPPPSPVEMPAVKTETATATALPPSSSPTAAPAMAKDDAVHRFSPLGFPLATTTFDVCGVWIVDCSARFHFCFAAQATAVLMDDDSDSGEFQLHVMPIDGFYS